MGKEHRSSMLQCVAAGSSPPPRRTRRMACSPRLAWHRQQQRRDGSYRLQSNGAFYFYCSGGEEGISLPESHALPSVKFFAECTISSTRQRVSLPSIGHSAKKNTRQTKHLPSVLFGTLGKGVYVPSAFLWHSAKYIYFFSFLLSNFFCCNVTLSLTTYANLAHYSNCLLYLVN
jgi:hypothetical protein